MKSVLKSAKVQLVLCCSQFPPEDFRSPWKDTESLSEIKSAFNVCFVILVCSHVSTRPLGSGVSSRAEVAEDEHWGHGSYAGGEKN